MLDLIRNNVQSFGVKFIVAVVVVVMTFFGVSAYRSQGVNTIATIDDYEIKVEKYQRAFDQAQNEIRRRYKGQAADYMKMIDLPSQIVQQLVNNALLLKSAEEMGLAVTDFELARALFETPAFQTDNRFDQKKYERMLANNRIDRLVYEKDLRENLLTDKYVQLIASGVLVSQTYAKQAYRRYKTQMTVQLLEFKPGMFTDDIQLTDAERETYYQAHKDQFQQKKQFVIRYFPLKIDDVKDRVIVRDKEVKRFYDKNKSDLFSTRASYLSRHILIPMPEGNTEQAMVEAKNKALQIYQQLTKEPGRFAELARRYSADKASAKEGGKLGWVEKGSFLGGFETAVEKLGKNEISPPFMTNYGYHIVQLLDRKPAVVKPFESVKNEIETIIRKRKAARRLDNKVTRLVDQDAGKSLQELASENNQQVKTSVAFDDAKNLPDLGYTYQLYQSLQSKKPDERGHFSLPGDEGVIVYEVAEVIDPFVKPLEDVKEKVDFFATSEKAKRLAAEKLKASESRITSKADFQKLARDLGVTAQTISFTYADRQSGQFRITDSFRNAVYEMEPSAIRAVTDGERQYLVYLADKQTGAVKDTSNDEYEALVNQLKRQKANILISGLIEEMKKKIDIEYNRSILNALDITYN